MNGKNYFELLEGKYATLAGPFIPNQEALSICGCLEKGKVVLWFSDNSKTIKEFLNLCQFFAHLHCTTLNAIIIMKEPSYEIFC